MRRISAFLLRSIQKNVPTTYHIGFTLLLVFSLTACGKDTGEVRTSAIHEEGQREVQFEIEKSDMLENEELNSEKGGMEDMNQHTQALSREEDTMNTIRLFVGGKELSVKWENNESVDALRELVGEHPLSIRMSMYGGFEQVGALGTDLPRSDVQTTTGAGDIVLYSGNQIVMFYGSNSWAYTRLGKVTDASADEMAELLGNGDVEITLSD